MVSMSVRVIIESGIDQFGEQTYICYGKEKGGLVRKTLSEEHLGGLVKPSMQ